MHFYRKSALSNKNHLTALGDTQLRFCRGAFGIQFRLSVAFDAAKEALCLAARAAAAGLEAEEAGLAAAARLVASGAVCSFKITLSIYYPHNTSLTKGWLSQPSLDPPEKREPFNLQ